MTSGFAPTMVQDGEEWDREHPNATEDERLEAFVVIWNKGWAACWAYCATSRKRIDEWAERQKAL